MAEAFGVAGHVAEFADSDRAAVKAGAEVGDEAEIERADSCLSLAVTGGGVRPDQTLLSTGASSCARRSFGFRRVELIIGNRNLLLTQHVDGYDDAPPRIDESE